MHRKRRNQSEREGNGDWFSVTTTHGHPGGLNTRTLNKVTLAPHKGKAPGAAFSDLVPWGRFAPLQNHQTMAYLGPRRVCRSSGAAPY
ncbi:MAG: hypothetical protein WBN60_00915, partial [Polyangiales bacterium]